MSLDSWQTHLYEHFRYVANERSKLSTHKPVFGLEHGLSPDQVEDLRSEIREHTTNMHPSNKHWIAWVVHATESGYTYSGDEYWSTFENDTPNWWLYGDRNWLRECFRRFADTFGGACPTGPWARHFSIISWPITHAILPQDLQRHLARVLFDIRHAIRPGHLYDPTTLGHLIHARSQVGSSRFKHLTQQTTLMGQIAASLLLRGSGHNLSEILPITLDRIANDLDAVQRAREWLRHAQTATTIRLKQSRLTSSKQRSNASWPTTKESARDEVESLALEPYLLLRVGNPEWMVYLEIPDFNPLITRFPQFGDILNNSRCQVQGAYKGQPMAAGRVLSNSRKIRIESWPREEELLIQFEHSKPELDYLLHTDCLLRSGPTWLFEYRTDNFAREIKSKKVSPGTQYILASTNSISFDNDWIRPLQLEPFGINAAALTVPDPVCGDFIQAVEAMGLTVSGSVEIWPAGLAPALWDGIGRGEWRTADTPRLGIRTNIQTERLTVIVGSNEPVALPLPSSVVGESQFIELPHLEIGTYEVLITASGRNPDQTVELGSFQVVMRDPHPWVSATNESSPLIVIPDPRSPTLEQLWNGQATFHVLAPPSRSIKCRLSLYEARDEQAFLETCLPSFTPPIAPSQWYQALTSHLGQLPNSASIRDRASRCHVEFRSDDLGIFQLESERASTPVRWVAMQASRNEYHLRVLDDRGSESELVLRYFNFDTPEHRQTLDTPTYIAKDGTPAADGLYVAQWEDQSQAVIVGQGRSLQDLGANPVIHFGARAKSRVIELLNQIELWRNADLRGDLSALTRRNSVVKALLGGLVDAIGNPGWGDVERALVRFNDSQSVMRLKQAVASNKDDELYRFLKRVCKEHDGNNYQIRQSCITWFVSTFSHRLIRPDSAQPPRWIAEFALRLASTPSSIRTWADSDFEFGLDELFRRPVLLRVARFAVLISDYESTPQPLTPDVLYTVWDWT